MFGLQFSGPQLSSVKTSSLQKGTRLCAGIPPTTGLQEFHHLPFSSATVFSWAVCRPRPASESLLMELQRVHLGRLARSWPQDVELQDKLLGSAAASGKAALTISSCRAREYRRRRICLVSVVMTPVTPDLKVTIPCRKQRLPQTFNP